MSQEAIIRHYRGATRADVEQSYRTEAAAAAEAGYQPLTHQWTADWQGFLLAVTYTLSASAPRRVEPTKGPPMERQQSATEISPPLPAAESAPSPITDQFVPYQAGADQDSYAQFAGRDDAATRMPTSDLPPMQSEPYLPPPEEAYTPQAPAESYDRPLVIDTEPYRNMADEQSAHQPTAPDAQPTYEVAQPTAQPYHQPTPENGRGYQPSLPEAQPAYEAPPAYEASRDMQPADVEPAYEAPLDVQPPYETPPAYETPADAQPIYEAHADDQPAYQSPAYAQPMEPPAAELGAPEPTYEQATTQEASYQEEPQYQAEPQPSPPESAIQQPSYEQATSEQPAYEESVAAPEVQASYPEPADEQQTYEQPAYEQPSDEQSAAPAPAVAQLADLPAVAPSGELASDEPEALELQTPGVEAPQAAASASRQPRLTVQTMDLHSAGEPLRIIRSGFPDVPNLPVLQRRQWILENADHIRRTVIQEPRGHRDMYGAILLPPHSDYADMTVLFMHNEGYSTMCGHGIIAITTGLIEEGLYPATEPVTTIRYEVPAGIVAANAATVRLENGDWAVQGVRFTNVPSYVAAKSLSVRPDGITLQGNAAQYGSLSVDLAFGGAYYGIVNAAELGLRVVPEQAEALRRAGAAITDVLRRDYTPSHPLDSALSFIYGTIIVDLDPRTSPDGRASGAHMRNATIFADAELDRSPCGSGTSAILAQLHARGRIQVGQEIVNAGITGEHFLGRVEAETALGPYPAISTSVAGTAYITGYSTFTVDSRDPLGEGFLLR